MKPSDFTHHPCMSVFNKCEPEVIARNIMKILKRTGNEFRELTWEEYAKERQESEQDKNFSQGEKRYFDDVIGYCKSAETAKLLSPYWRKQHNDKTTNIT